MTPAEFAVSLPKKTLAVRLLGAKRWVVIAMLLALHGALISPSGSDYERVWLLIHFGLFLLWQPFVNTDRALNRLAVAMLLAITAAVLVVLADWMVVAWLAILIGILGGKVFTLQHTRRGMFYLVAVFYLFAMLLIWAVPVFLLGIAAFPAGVRTLVSVFLPTVLVSMAVLPFRADDEAAVQVFDFFYSLLVFQLVVVLVLGSIAAMRITEDQYFQAVLLTVFGFAALLFILAVLWSPRAGFGGLRTTFSRYLMSVGMPFELWMRRIATLSENEAQPARFLGEAMAEIASLQWLKGGAWHSPDGAGNFGSETRHATRFRHHELDITFFSESRLSPALSLHLRLLAQVVGEFYEGKRREHALKQHAYMQAVHETGARLTHDIKNLLQSLVSLTAAGVDSAERRDVERRRVPGAYEALLARQLPQLTARLQTTLEKLQNPAIDVVASSAYAHTWWADVCARYEHNVDGNIDDTNVHLHAESPDEHTRLPVALFDAVLENCFENARQKQHARRRLAGQRAETTLNFTVTLALQPAPSLTITDDGDAIAPDVAARLFRQPIERPNASSPKAADSRGAGLGIGLYQAARQAAREGYELVLTSNREGAVTFQLRKL
jgi:hypothetical protein